MDDRRNGGSYGAIAQRAVTTEDPEGLLRIGPCA